MTEPADGRSAGQHRRASGNRLVGLLVSLTLVVIAAAGVLVVLHWRGEGTRPPAAGASSASHHPTPSAPHTSASASRSSSPPAAASSASAPPASSTGPTSIAPSSVPPGSPAAPAATTLVGSAAAPADPGRQDSGRHLERHPHQRPGRKAEKTLTSGGWTVASTGNYAHTITQTTVYYQPGQQASAQLLATQFPKIHRVVAAPAGLTAGHLTLVLAQDWA